MNENSAKHTPEPWQLFDGKSSSRRGGQIIYSGNCCESLDTPFSFHTVAIVETDTPKFNQWTPNALRIVNCVNALRGIDTDKINHVNLKAVLQTALNELDTLSGSPEVRELVRSILE